MVLAVMKIADADKTMYNITITYGNEIHVSFVYDFK